MVPVRAIVYLSQKSSTANGAISCLGSGFSVVYLVRDGPRVGTVVLLVPRLARVDADSHVCLGDPTVYVVIANWAPCHHPRLV